MRGRRNKPEDFWFFVDKTSTEVKSPHVDTPCWEWVGSTYLNGYGRWNFGCTTTSAHRFAFEMEHGPIEGDLCVLHRCDNRRCVRHLFLGTRQDNAEDRDLKGRTAVGERHRSRTRPDTIARGEQNHRAKLTADAVLDIRSRRASGVLLRVLASEYGVSESAISAVARGGHWQHVVARDIMVDA